MKRPVIIAIVLVVLLAALGIGGYYYYQRLQAQAQQSKLIQVSGTVDTDDVQLSSLIAGKIVEAKLAEGDAVKGGQVLYKIDPRALKLQVDQAAEAVTAAEARYDQEVDNDASDADIAAAKAQLQQARAAEKIARVQLSYATITSPATGTVTAVAFTLGETATPGRTLATIAKTGSLFVRTFVPEPQIGEVSVGTPATIVTDSGRRLTARVTFIAAQAEFTPSNVETKDQRATLVYEVRLAPDSTQGLTAGMPVDVVIGQ